MKKRISKKGYQQQRKPRARRVTVNTNHTLLAFLYELMKEQSKSSVKAMLGHGQISVNGKVTSQFDMPLSPNDVVGISYERGKVEFNHPMLKVVWEDDFLIVVNKKHGLLSVGNEREKERTALHLLSNYVKKTDLRNKIYVLHRLDKETSGLMIFAKNRGVQDRFHSGWGQMVKNQSFVAVVEGKPDKEHDLMTSFEREDPDMRVFVTAAGDGVEAITRYQMIRSNGQYSLLELTLESGRRNQMRAQLGRIGHPIVGDKKNAAESNPADRLLLHSHRLVFIHPETGDEMTFETQIPNLFNGLTK